MTNHVATILIVIAVSCASQASSFAKGDAEAGKNTFEQNKCNRCHAEMLGGNGNAMFTRAERKVKTHASLSTQITRCSTNLGLMLFEDDEEGLVAYLNKEFYKFK